MNIKTFLIFKICDVLPPELRYYILDIIKDSAVFKIQRLYMYKVSKNLDIFFKLYHFSNNNNININNDAIYMNKFIKYCRNNITYSYIQEPAIWIDYLEYIIDNYRIYKNFHVNNVCLIINKIKQSDEIYRNTGIEWWNRM